MVMLTLAKIPRGTGGKHNYNPCEDDGYVQFIFDFAAGVH
jgi:hypothetical protein